MKLLEGTIDPSASTSKVFEPDVIKDPNLHLKLNVDKSKAYVKQILANMDAKEALQFLHDQVLTKNLLINDAVLQLLEDLAEPTLGMKERLILVQAVQALTASSTQITQNKIALDKALGMGLLPHVPETSASPVAAHREVSESDFNEAYKKATEKQTVPK